jgi:uncharacterized OB-fold protein
MSAPPVDLAKCRTCHHRFVPADGVCPRCASKDVEPFQVPALATVLASTAVAYPAAGWTTPHLLALVELTESVRLLVEAEEPLPQPGAVVEVERARDHWKARPAP